MEGTNEEEAVNNLSRIVDALMIDYEGEECERRALFRDFALYCDFDYIFITYAQFRIQQRGLEQEIDIDEDFLFVLL